MDLMDIVQTRLGWIDLRLMAVIEKYLKKIPAVNAEIEKEYDSIMGELDGSLKPYRDSFPAFAQIPQAGIGREEIIGEMEAMREKEESRWKDGFVSGAVYHGDEEHIRFLNRVYALNSQSNPLHSDLWPSTTKFEAEIVSMTATMLGAARASDPICGTLSSGGTESILLAMKTYRDRARDQKGITRPEMIAPITAHAAFEKAAQYFNIKMVRVPVDANFRADVAATRKAINGNTVVIVGSAPSFPHGAIDPIEPLSELARERGIGFHTDACLGGFVLPWAEKLGYHVPPFDFRLRGVTSISADTHKYGYAAKGTSVILYRGLELRRYQYYSTADWPGGLYFSPTFAGSRPGALSAACWATLVTMGEQGYMQATKKILETAATLKKGIAAIPELRLLGDPLWVIAFAS
ncbi:MAG: aminotransferase class V-fold PLP-dependent enzyme, partial [Chloroflexi bacterium]|nr:aminotransferase class V-fold PLP-dependent enzyme [Chloroflexota bacterium]